MLIRFRPARWVLHRGHCLLSGHADVASRSPRLDRLAAVDPANTELVRRLLGIAVRGLPRTFIDEEFVFRVDGTRAQAGTWKLTPAGKSRRYGAIVALGLLRLPEDAPRGVLPGRPATTW